MGSERIPVVVLERYLLGELPVSQSAEIERQLAIDSQLQARIANMQADNQSILKQYPAASMLSRLGQFAAQPTVSVKELRQPVSTRRFTWAAIPLAAMALLAAGLMVVWQSWQPNSYGIRDKGISPSQPCLYVYCKHGNGQTEQLKAGAHVRCGELLQLAYRPGGAIYGVIFSIDGNGLVTLHYPAMVNDLPLLQHKARVLLANAYELDNAAGFERFFFITAKATIDTAMVLKQAEQLAKNTTAARLQPLQLPAGLEQYSITLAKETK